MLVVPALLQDEVVVRKAVLSSALARTSALLSLLPGTQAAAEVRLVPLSLSVTTMLTRRATKPR